MKPSGGEQSSMWLPISVWSKILLQMIQMNSIATQWALMHISYCPPWGGWRSDSDSLRYWGCPSICPWIASLHFQEGLLWTGNPPSASSWTLQEPRSRKPYRIWIQWAIDETQRSAAKGVSIPSWSLIYSLCRACRGWPSLPEWNKIGRHDKTQTFVHLLPFYYCVF